MVDDNSGDEGKVDFFNPEEEVSVGSEAKAVLPDKEVKSGEENDELIFKIRAKLYRWRDPEWKERGIGDCKLLRNKETNKIRLILRQDKTLKPAANFLLEEDPLCLLKEHLGSEKMFVFAAYDFSDGEAVLEKFAIRLGNAESKIAF